jgi:hypothetical protein
MSAEVPAWLQQWRAKQPQPQPPAKGARHRTRPKPATPLPLAPAAVPIVRPDSYGFTEPTPWAWDGGVRRGEVLDHDSKPPRVVRLVGWRVCMKCRKPFWSGDVRRLRMCAGCKSRTDIRKVAGDAP